MNRILSSALGGWIILAPALLPAETNSNPAIAPHARDLVVLEGGKLVPFNSDKFLQAPYTILYFGAGWCPDCRKFSPQLMNAYDRQPTSGKHFEVLMLSRDKTAEAMLQFMRSEKMKWPALAFGADAAARDFDRYYSGHGIPYLTVIDSSGKIVAQSKDDQDAMQVLQAVEDLLKKQKE